MCTICGCDAHEPDPDPDHGRDHDHDHDHVHAHAHDDARVIKLEADVLAKSRRLAADNRAWLKARGVTMVNLMSAPGAGKTTLLEKTARAWGAPLYVVEGDQATSFDADRVRAAGARSVQINTGAGCHLDPHSVRHALEDLDLPKGALVIVENVGNLVCPALFDLGESEKVVIFSLPEGDDKPLKYPHMFTAASLVVLNKVDLLPYVPFDMARATDALGQVNRRAPVLRLSAHTGEGVGEWIGWLRGREVPS